jgi:hypothetical protein
MRAVVEQCSDNHQHNGEFAKSFSSKRFPLNASSNYGIEGVNDEIPIPNGDRIPAIPRFLFTQGANQFSVERGTAGEYRRGKEDHPRRKQHSNLLLQTTEWWEITLLTRSMLTSPVFIRWKFPRGLA